MVTGRGRRSSADRAHPRGPDWDEILFRREPQVCDVTAALLRLAPDDRRAFIPSPVTMLGGVVADEGRHRAGRDVIAHPARTVAVRIGRLARLPAPGGRDTTMGP
jgi:hypothetical protein